MRSEEAKSERGETGKAAAARGTGHSRSFALREPASHVLVVATVVALATKHNQAFYLLVAN